MNTSLKYHGGKHYLKKWLVELFPKRDSYLAFIDGCVGGGSVLLEHDPEGKIEIINDLDGCVANFWNVLKDQFDEFARMCQATPVAQTIWEEAANSLETGSPVERAWAFFVCCRQSMSGRMDCFSPISLNRTRRGMAEQASAWLGAVDGLPELHARMKRVIVLSMDVLELIPDYDKKGVFIYLDTPYHPDTRASKEVYRCDTTSEWHAKYLNTLARVKNAMVMVSGYPHPSYDEVLSGWNKQARLIDNKAAKSDIKRQMTETIWRNYM